MIASRTEYSSELFAIHMSTAVPGLRGRSWSGNFIRDEAGLSITILDDYKMKHYFFHNV